MTLFLRDIIYSARSFLRTPGLCFALLISIALGTGGNAVIQGFVRGLTPVSKLAGTNVVSIFRTDAHRQDAPVSLNDLKQIALADFEWLGTAHIERGIAAVSPELAAFLNGEPIYTDLPIDRWTPLDRRSLDPRRRNLWAIGKIRPGASVPAGLQVVPYTGVLPEKAQALQRVSFVLTAAAWSVFFIACANVAAFLLGRATTRSQEASLRVAIGAARWDLARGVLSDSIVISIAGGLLGALLALWLTRIVPALLFEEDAQRLIFAPDAHNIVFVSLVSIAITIACGMLPLFALPYNRPASVLRRESSGPSPAMHALRSAMVMAQMACCCFLIVSTGFLIEGLRDAMKTPISHTLGTPVLASVQTGERYEFFEDIEREARAMPGVTPLAWADRLPGNQPDWRSYRIDPPSLPTRQLLLDLAPFPSDPPKTKAGRLFGFADRGCPAAVVNDTGAETLFGDDSVGRSLVDPGGRRVDIIGIVTEHGRRPTIYFNHRDPVIHQARFRAPESAALDTAEFDTRIVSPAYFATMGLSLIAGKLFPKQSRRFGCRIAVVNQQAADLYFAGNPIGSSVIDESGNRTEIIGVMHSPPLGTFERTVEPTIYLPMVQDYIPRMTLIFSAAQIDDQFLADARRRFDAVRGRGPLPATVKTLDTHLRQTALAPLRIATAIVAASAASALLLSILGLYGTLDDAARRRNRETAVRIALGARRRHLIAQVLRGGAMLAFAGAAVGLLAALIVARFLPIGSPAPLWIWLAGPAVLACAVAVSAILPARRSSLVDPLRIMRDTG